MFERKETKSRDSHRDTIDRTDYTHIHTHNIVAAREMIQLEWLMWFLGIFPRYGRATAALFSREEFMRKNDKLR